MWLTCVLVVQIDLVAPLGNGEVKSAGIMMLKDANSKQVITDVKSRITEIQKSLPEGYI
jgi:Cu/Ag efflux pump CusA